MVHNDLHSHFFISFIIIFHFVYVCMFVSEYIHMSPGALRPSEEGVESLEARLTGGCELPYIDAGH